MLDELHPIWADEERRTAAVRAAATARAAVPGRRQALERSSPGTGRAARRRRRAHALRRRRSALASMIRSAMNLRHGPGSRTALLASWWSPLSRWVCVRPGPRPILSGLGHRLRDPCARSGRGDDVVAHDRARARIRSDLASGRPVSVSMQSILCVLLPGYLGALWPWEYWAHLVTFLLVIGTLALIAAAMQLPPRRWWIVLLAWSIAGPALALGRGLSLGDGVSAACPSRSWPCSIRASGARGSSVRFSASPPSRRPGSLRSSGRRSSSSFSPPRSSATCRSRRDSSGWRPGHSAPCSAHASSGPAVRFMGTGIPGCGRSSEQPP